MIDLVGVQDRTGVLFFISCLLAFSSMSSIDTCKKIIIIKKLKTHLF